MKRNIASGVVLGIFVVFAGCIALLNSILGWHIGLGFWGVIGLIIAACSIVSIINTRVKVSNVFWLVIGGWMFLGDSGLFNRLSFPAFIAILIIAIGVWIIVNAITNQRSKVTFREVDENGQQSDSNDFIKYEVSFGETRVANSSKSFRGGIVSASFGHMVCDLSNIQIQGEARIQVDASFGEVEIILPSGVPYKTAVSPFAGSFENKAPIVNVVNGQPFIEIVGSATFGSVKIR